MSGIGGDISNDPFRPKQTTTQIFPIPIQTSTPAFVFPTTPTTPTPSLPPLTFSTEATEVVTKTKLDPSLPAISTVSHRGTNTLTLAVPKGQGSNNNNNNNTISTAAIIFSIMIGFVIVGGCITLIFTRKRHPENKKKRTEIIQRNLYGEEPCELNESNDNDRIVVRPINSISPPLNLPPPPPQRSPHPPSSPRDSLPLPPIPQFPPPPQHLPSSSPSPSPSPPPTPEHPPPQPLPSIPQHSPIVLYRNPSLKRNGSKNNYDYNISEDYYQRYSQLRPPSASASASSANSYNNVEDRSTSEPP